MRPLSIPSASRFRNRRAFSIVELLTVVVVMILLMSLATQLGKMGGQQRQTKMAADTVVGAIEQARTYALANNTYAWVGLLSDPSTNLIATAVVASKNGLANSGTANLLSVGKIHQKTNFVFDDPPNSNAGSVNYSALGSSSTSFMVVYKTGTLNFNHVIQFNPLGEATDASGAPLSGISIGVEPKIKNATPKDGSAISIHVNGFTGKAVLDYYVP